MNKLGPNNHWTSLSTLTNCLLTKTSASLHEGSCSLALLLCKHSRITQDGRWCRRTSRSRQEKDIRLGKVPWGLTVLSFRTDLHSIKMQTPAALEAKATEDAATPQRSPVRLSIEATCLLLNAQYWHAMRLRTYELQGSLHDKSFRLRAASFPQP